MKFYSEKLNKIFDSVEELHKAEKVVKEEEMKQKARLREAEKVKNQRKAEIEVIHNEMDNAYAKYLEVAQKYETAIKAYNKDYGAYTTTIHMNDAEKLDRIFKEIFGFEV